MAGLDSNPNPETEAPGPVDRSEATGQGPFARWQGPAAHPSGPAGTSLERGDRRLRFELKALALVASGAVPGALVRWQLVERLGPQLGGPRGANLLANLVGCLLLGFLCGPLPYRTPLMLALGIGFCGSLTTFSGWILDLADLHQQGLGQGLGALALLLTSLGLGLLAALGGRALSRRLFRGRPPQP